MQHSSKSPAPPLLVLSNGHGEDLIAARVLAALRRQGYDGLMEGMALVGLGAGLASVPGFRLFGIDALAPGNPMVDGPVAESPCRSAWAGRGGCWCCRAADCPSV